MKQLFTLLFATLMLAACKPEKNEEPVLYIKPNLMASEAAAVSAPAAPSSPIVAQILNTPSEVDVITSSKQAMKNVSASEIAAASDVASHGASEAEMVFVPEDDLPDVKLPPVCEQYYKRVDTCFSKQDQSEELRLMNQEARVDLATDKPTDKTCEALNKSFDAVARSLGCQ